MMVAAWQSEIFILLSGIIFAVVHSLTAAEVCKQWFYRRGLGKQGYRLLYSATSIVFTLGWLYAIAQLSDKPLYHTDGVLYAMLLGLQGLGVLIALAAFQPIDGMAFLGLRKLEGNIDGFVVQGVYRWMRHPMYSGAMLMLLAQPEQTSNGLSLALVLCLYFVLGSRLEEARMLVDHPDYKQYQQKVSAFIPSIQGFNTHTP